MIYQIVTPDLQSALKRLGDLIEYNPETVVFCGDRYTLLVEQTICQRLGGTFSTNVLTFARYLRGFVSDRMLSKYGSVMAVRRLLADKKGMLECFNGDSDVAVGVYDTIIRLSSSKITPEMLDGATVPNPVLKGKIKDLALLESEYEKFLSENKYLDESSYFRLLPEVIRGEGSFKGKHVVLFGFPSFAAQMKEGISACMETAMDTTFFFFGGEEPIFRNEAEANVKELIEGKMKRQYFALPVRKEVSVLRKGLYNPECFASTPTFTDQIRLFEAKTVTGEIERVAIEIAKSIRQGKRYRDEVVLLPDLKKYALPLRSIFDEYGIPYFIDLKKSMSEHPLASYLLSALEMTADGLSFDAVESFVSNPYFGKADEYRNYLSEYASFRGGVKKELKHVMCRVNGKEEEKYSYGSLVFFRDKVLSSLLPDHAEGQEYVRLLRNLMKGADKTTAELKKLLADSYDQNFLERGAKEIEKVLAEAEALTNGYLMTANEMEILLRDGLSALEVSMIPLKADAVFVGDLEMSKFLPVPDLYVLGLTEKVPHLAEDTALLSDQELDLLTKDGLIVEPTGAQSNLRTKESVAMNLCSFTEHLSCFVPMEEDAGKSEILTYLVHLFTETGAMGLTYKTAEEVDLSLLSYASVSRELALKRLLLKKIDADNGTLSEGMGALYRALETKGEKERTDLYYQGLERNPYIHLGEELFFGKGTVSPTLIETYFSCPYRNFIEKGLKAEARKSGAVESTDTGNFVHAVLETLSGEIKDGTVNSYESCEERARAISTALLNEPPYSYALDTKSGAYSMTALVDETVKIARAAYRTIEQSEFKVTFAEEGLKFGQNGEFFGRVDRVDEANGVVRVVDYKTGKVEASAEAYYTGRKLQLGLYLAATSKGKTPGGAFYFPASIAFTEGNDTNFRMTGFVNAASVPLLDTKMEGNKSELFDNCISDRANGPRLLSESFSDFVDYSMLLAEEAEKELKKGFIGASSHEECPEWCTLKGVCGSEGDRCRKKEKITCIEIAEIARRKKEEQ